MTATQLAELAASVGTDELERAKAQLRASLVMARESVAGCGDALARQIMLFGAPVDDSDLLDQIAAVDAEKVRSVAEDLVSGNAPAIAAIGPDSSVMENGQLASLLSGKLRRDQALPASPAKNPGSIPSEAKPCSHRVSRS